MNLPLFQVDAFTSVPFRGNPAAIVPLEAWLDDEILQQIALENNLSETAYFVRTDERDEADFHLRWFTPAREVNLCGHATLASAHVLWRHCDFPREQIVFRSRSGLLRVRRDEPRIILDFPAIQMVEIEVTIDIARAFGIAPQAAFTAAQGAIEAGGLMAVFRSEDEVRNVKPDFQVIRSLPPRGCAIATAPGGDSEVDFVSRFFAPGSGIDEDPVTGSAHCALTPYWSSRLGKRELTARQVSMRGGELFVRNLGDRVEIGGEAVTVLVGEMVIPHRRPRSPVTMPA